MRHEPVAVFLRHLVLPALDLRGQELVYPPAFEADQVVVVLPRQFRLEPGQPVLQVDRGRDPGFAEQAQRPIDRRAPHAGVGGAHFRVEVVGGDMPAHSQEPLEDEFALPGLLEPVLLRERPQPLERFLAGRLRGRDWFGHRRRRPDRRPNGPRRNALRNIPNPVRAAGHPAPGP